MPILIPRAEQATIKKEMDVLKSKCSKQESKLNAYERIIRSFNEEIVGLQEDHDCQTEKLNKMEQKMDEKVGKFVVTFCQYLFLKINNMFLLLGFSPYQVDNAASNGANDNFRLSKLCR